MLAAPYAYGAGFGYGAYPAYGYGAGAYGLGWFNQQHGQQHPGMTNLAMQQPGLQQASFGSFMKKALHTTASVANKVGGVGCTAAGMANGLAGTACKGAVKGLNMADHAVNHLNQQQLMQMQQQNMGGMY